MYYICISMQLLQRFHMNWKEKYKIKIDDICVVFYFYVASNGNLHKLVLVVPI